MQINNIVLKQIWEDRYRKNGETLDENLQRVANYIGEDSKDKFNFYNVMNKGLFFPAGRTMSNSGIGTNLTLNNCFVANFVEDNIEDIFDKVKLGALTHKRGGGIGYEFSKLRPKGSQTSNDAIASGVTSFMDVFNTQTATILQGGRRGANMGILSIYHPDIFDYLAAKSYDEGRLTHFNLSIMVDDDFMVAKNNNEKIILHYPIYDEKGLMISDPDKWICTKEFDANELWNLIMTNAYNTGEYGVFFYDNLNRDNNTYYIETIVCTNPCGEYLSGLLFGENPTTKEEIKTEEYMGACNLGSLFLHNFVSNPFTSKVELDYVALGYAISTGVRLLDNIIDINKFPHENYENYQKNMRTIGLGDTGIADVLAMFNIKYGSKEAIDFVDKLENFITKKAYWASIELAKEKGSFPFLDKDKFIQSGFIQKHIIEDPEWNRIADAILAFGIRNARIRTEAPTGTLSLTYGNNCSSGLEPIFSLSYDRKVKIGGQDDKDIQIIKMEDYAYGLWKQTTEDNIVKEDVFVTAMSLPVQAHLDMLKAIAFHVDMSCSKTINIPTDYPYEETKKVYDYCWDNGIKGCTIFRPNPIRQGIMIAEEQNKPEEVITTELPRGVWKPKAADTFYHERKVAIGCGKLMLFIGWSEIEKEIQDFFVIRSGSGGCEKNIQTSVIAMSGMIRLGGKLENIERAFEGLGGCNSFVGQRAKGVKLSRGGSCGTAILNEIKLFESEMAKGEVKIVAPISAKTEEVSGKSAEEILYLQKNGEIAYAKHYNKCPVCDAELTNSGGCIICKDCGFSKCD